MGRGKGAGADGLFCGAFCALNALEPFAWIWDVIYAKAKLLIRHMCP